jgi:hypothetical protein
VVMSYSNVPWTVKAQLDNDCLVLVWKWLGDLQRSPDLLDSEYASFAWYCMMFFLHVGKLWCKDPQQWHKLVVTPALHMTVLWAAHDDVAHKGFHTTYSLITLHIWWPHLCTNIAWFIWTCCLYQLRQTHNILIPLTVAIPPPMFTTKAEHKCTCGWPGSIPTGISNSKCYTWIHAGFSHWVTQSCESKTHGFSSTYKYSWY